METWQKPRGGVASVPIRRGSRGKPSDPPPQPPARFSRQARAEATRLDPALTAPRPSARRPAASLRRGRRGARTTLPQMPSTPTCPPPPARSSHRRRSGAVGSAAPTLSRRRTESAALASRRSAAAGSAANLIPRVRLPRRRAAERALRELEGGGARAGGQASADLRQSAGGSRPGRGEGR